MFKLYRITFVMLLLLSVSASALNAAPLQTVNENQVNWQNGTVEALGFGAPPANAANAAQTKILARRAAVVDAYRNLAELIEGVQIDGETTMVDAMIRSDVVKTKVQALIKNARIIKEEISADGVYQVHMVVDLYGNDGLAAIAIGSVRPTDEPNLPFAEPSEDFMASYTGGKYTGVIIDARGLDLQRTFSPVIYDTNGIGLYGVKNIDAQFAIAKGMVGYLDCEKGQNIRAVSIDRSSRAGNNPLIIQALAVRRTASLAIGPADGNRLLAANKQNRFLERCAVVFAY